MLDVSDALGNVDLLDIFTVLRRREIMNTYGESKLSIEKITGQQGVVYPEGLNDLSRRPEAQTQAKSIVVYTSFLLRGASETVDGCNYQPDVIYWNGDNFVVVRVEDWSRYFPNFVKVTAESIDIVDMPPSEGGSIYIVSSAPPPASSQGQLCPSPPPPPVVSGVRRSAIMCVIDGNGLPPRLGNWGQISLPFACKVLGWTLTADQPGNAVLDVLRGTFAGFPTVASITGSDKPTLSGTQKNENLVVSAWDTALNTGDILQINLLSVSTCTQLNLAIIISVY